MVESRYTSEGLPVIKDDVFARMIDKLKNGLDDDLAGNLRTDNPKIFDLMKTMFELYNGNSFARGCLAGTMFTYELLRRQSAANKLERDLE